MARSVAGKLSAAKARLILEDGTVNGKPLTKRQRGYFGIIASGKTPKRAKGKK